MATSTLTSAGIEAALTATDSFGSAADLEVIENAARSMSRVLAYIEGCDAIGVMPCAETIQSII